jgi:hypothetical protein
MKNQKELAQAYLGLCNVLQRSIRTFRLSSEGSEGLRQLAAAWYVISGVGVIIMLWWLSRDHV